MRRRYRRFGLSLASIGATLAAARKIGSGKRPSVSIIFCCIPFEKLPGNRCFASVIRNRASSAATFR